jgi:His-Xaa-Ser system protein HxsD
MSGSLNANDGAIEIELDGIFFSADAILKTCYWYSRNFTFDVKQPSERQILVTLRAKDATVSTDNVTSEFIAVATDFSLRERIETRTSSIRETLLAKAFAESGVLEDPPSGVFVDQVEREKEDGLFKILPD